LNMIFLRKKQIFAVSVFAFSSLLLSSACKQRTFNSKANSSGQEGSDLNTEGAIETTANVVSPAFLAPAGECEKSAANAEGGYDVAKRFMLRLSPPAFETKYKGLAPAPAPGEAGKPYNEIMTEYEFGLVLAYSGGLYRELNQSLLEDKVPATSVPRVKCLTSAVNKLAKNNGGFNRTITYRGVYLRNEFLEKYKKGETVTENMFLSTSLSRNVALNFSGLSAGGSEEGKTSVLFLFQLSGSMGADISPISASQEEAEILLPAGHSFEVIDRTEETAEVTRADQVKVSGQVVVVKLAPSTK
jgi:hypothetical protein